MTKMNEALTLDFTKTELLKACFSMKAMKSLSPNGYSATFFQHNWAIIKEGLTRVANSFAQQGRLLKELIRPNWCLSLK